MPGEGLNSIWATVNHVRLENEVLLRRLQGTWTPLQWLPSDWRGW